jgi:hypothetical protein
MVSLPYLSLSPVSDFGVQIKASVDSVYPLVLETHPVETRLITALVFGLFISAVSLSKSLAAKPVIYTTWLSTVLYTAWLVAALYNHATVTPMPSPTWLERGVLWNDYSKYTVLLPCL